MNDALREQVRARANQRSEYCPLAQDAIPNATFHVEHIIAIQHGGADELKNLALACDRCNAYKGTNLTALDPPSGALTALFHPRRVKWPKHFRQVGYEIQGATEIGRATARLLNMNAPRRVQLRAELNIDLNLNV